MRSLRWPTRKSPPAEAVDREEEAEREADDARPVRRESPLRSRWRRFRRSTDRYRLLTDVVGAILMVGMIIGGLAIATGGVWPPVVVVESGSMMHSIQETPYGRIGTIDVGDIVFVRAVDGPEDFQTWAEGGDLHYDRPGDVIAFWANGDRNGTMVLHRAIAYVEVTNDIRSVKYTLHWTDGQQRSWGREGIYFPPLGFDENAPTPYSPKSGWRPGYSGFITKGDNAYSNPMSDQALGITDVVDIGWIEAKVYGEIPWMGLGKLALQSGQTNPHNEFDGWKRVGNAFAPLELWSTFFSTIALIILIPLTIDTFRAWRRIRREQETTRRIEEQNRRTMEAKRAAERQREQKRIVSFAEVVSSRPVRPPPAKDGSSGR